MTAEQFGSDGVYGKHCPRSMAFNEPFPKVWANIKSEIGVLGLNEDIGIEKIHQPMPSS